MLECRILSPEWERGLAELFRAAADDYRFFHPHPLTDEKAHKLAHYSGEDLYYVLILSGKVIGYAMLRGWDEGYEIPSSGILIHPDYRRRGFGETLKRFLYSAAKCRGAKQVLVHVEKTNIAIRELNEKLGHVFHEDGDCLVSYLEL